MNNPGNFILHGQLTVAEAVQAAGGFQLATAKHSHVPPLRRVSQDMVSSTLIDLKRILDKGTWVTMCFFSLATCCTYPRTGHAGEERRHFGVFTSLRTQDHNRERPRRRAGPVAEAGGLILKRCAKRELCPGFNARPVQPNRSHPWSWER